MKKQLSLFFTTLKHQAFFKLWAYFGSLLLVLFSFIPDSSAQSKIWDKTIGGTANDILTTVQQTVDGGYLLAGYSYSGVSGEKTDKNREAKDRYQKSVPTADYWIVKLKADRTKAWDKTFGGTSEDLLAAVVQTSDGGFIL